MNLAFSVLLSLSLSISWLQINPVHKQGSLEVLSLKFPGMLEFLCNRYLKGSSIKFEDYGANPKILTRKAALRPATILVHSSESNQGQWRPLLRSVEKQSGLGPLFTFNYKDGDELDLLKQKIIEIKALYKNAGVDEVIINLVGHSLGGIASAEYAFSPEIWIEGTRVGKVITIAARLKNIDNVLDTPYYAYALPTLKRIENIFPKIEENSRNVEFFTIAAENDWLVPEQSVLIAKDTSHKAIIPEVGHVTIPQSDITNNLIIKWLSVN